jgi:hypothetical protein
VLTTNEDPAVADRWRREVRLQLLFHRGSTICGNKTVYLVGRRRVNDGVMHRNGLCERKLIVRLDLPNDCSGLRGECVQRFKGASINDAVGHHGDSGKKVAQMGNPGYSAVRVPP